mgnify:CR=1 FL=1
MKREEYPAKTRRSCIGCFCARKVHGEFGCLECRCKIPHEECTLLSTENRSCEDCISRQQSLVTGTKPIVVVHIQNNGKKKRASVNPGDLFSYCNKGYWGGIMLQSSAKRKRKRMGRPRGYILSDHAQLCADFNSEKGVTNQDDS